MHTSRIFSYVRNTTADADTVYYVMTDLLGSWELVVKPNRNLVQSCHFDPWGNRMSHGFWTIPHPDSTFRFRRGFTGHEHYDRFGIINMNARLYEPAIARFFSPDPQVQNLQVVSRGGSMLAFEVFLQFPYSHVTGGNFAFLV